MRYRHEAVQLCFDYIYHRVQKAHPDKFLYSKLMECPSEIQKSMRALGEKLSKKKSFDEVVPITKTIQTKDQFYNLCSCLFRDGALTWGRIIVMFEIAALVGEELAQFSKQGCIDCDQTKWLLAILFFPKIEQFVISQGGWKRLVTLNQLIL